MNYSLSHASSMTLLVIMLVGLDLNISIHPSIPLTIEFLLLNLQIWHRDIFIAIAVVSKLSVLQLSPY